MVPYTLIRSDRRTIALIIERDGELTVRAPKRAPVAQIEAFIREKEDWITRKQSEAQKREKSLRPLTGSEGESLLFLGEPLVLTSSDAETIGAAEGRLLLPRKTTIDDLRKWLREQALCRMTENVARRSSEMGLNCLPPKLTEAKGRWGSCSGKNVIRLSWRLVLCPEQVMDYVVIHELCHIWHKNHSREFWLSVSKFCPDWKIYRKWLRDHREIMELI